MPLRNVPAIVLAAGASRRCPEGKLLKLFRGSPLLVWTLSNLSKHREISRIFLVCGHAADQIIALSHDFEKVIPVGNADWPNGLSTSIVAGIAELPGDSAGTLVTLGDTPFFTSNTLLKVIPKEDEIEQIRYPTLDGVPGHPKYFPAWLFPELRALQGDQGAQSLLRRYPGRCCPLEVQDSGILRDFDTPQDFENWSSRSWQPS
jgi:molybdenum cofactor cytidylyltransferase